MSQILYTDPISKRIKKALKKYISNQTIKPRLVIIQVDNSSESEIYTRRKNLFAMAIGAEVENIILPKNVSEKMLLEHIALLNIDKRTHGIIVQIPLPKHIDKNFIVEAILPHKDVDGLTSTNLKLLSINSKEAIIPATTKGVLQILDTFKIDTVGKHVVVVGRSTLVGKPTALACLNRDATVTICHSKTKNLAQYTKQADILIVAAGVPKLITKKHVSKNQVVIDIGISHISQNGKTILSGDVDFDAVKNIVRAITPIPGGVGPMTVASLFENLVETYKRQRSD